MLVLSCSHHTKLLPVGITGVTPGVYRLHDHVCCGIAFGLATTYRLHGHVSFYAASAKPEGAVKRFDCQKSCRQDC